MGIKLDSCSCFKNSDDIAIEVELNSDKENKIQILMQHNEIPIYKKELIKSCSTEHELSKIIKKPAISEKSCIKPINNIKPPEVVIQSIFRGYKFRKRLKEISGLKTELIEKNNEIIKSIEKNFLSKLTLKGEKLFLNEKFEDNWKKYYNLEEIEHILNKNKNIIKNNEKDIIIKTKCLLSNYKNENCLYKGSLSLNSIQKNTSIKNAFNIDSLTGKGSLYLKNGKKYEGNFIKGELNGWCRYINTKGVCYEGLFINGVLNGKGEIIKIDDNRRKNIYKGDIKNFKKEGKGEEKTNDYFYEGDFVNDLRHGKGKIIFYNNNADSYEGQFTNGEITGKGFYIWKNKHTYLGDFVSGKMHGRGLYKWPDGNQYEGEYINNIKEGQGEFKWKDGRIYKGSFKKGKPHGNGLLIIKGITLNAIFDNGQYLGDLQSSLSSPINS